MVSFSAIISVLTLRKGSTLPPEIVFIVPFHEWACVTIEELGEWFEVLLKAGWFKYLFSQ